MSNTVESGMLRAFFITSMVTRPPFRRRHLSFCKITRTIHCSDRYSTVKVGDCIVINVYLPCVGSVNRQLVCEEVLAEIDA